jgi:hypothetical protein
MRQALVQARMPASGPESCRSHPDQGRRKGWGFGGKEVVKEICPAKPKHLVLSCYVEQSRIVEGRPG